jgi:hypothetical protein
METVTIRIRPEPDSVNVGTLADADMIDALDAGSTEEVSSARRLEATVEDERLVAEASTLLAALSADPAVAIQMAQTWIRDIGLESREESALSADARAELDAILAEAARETERAAAAAAADDAMIAKIFGYIGAAIAVAVGTVGAVFSGGATLALAIAAVVLVAAATTTNVLVDTNLVSAEVGGAVALGCSVAASICSLGAAVGGTVALTAGSAARIASDALSYTGAAVQTVTAWESGEAAVHVRTAADAEADRVAADTDREGARSVIDECADAIRGLFRSHRRTAERSAELRETRSAGMRAACVRL